jgi:glycosyltransferase involved in cell wall biosynthesis
VVHLASSFAARTLVPSSESAAALSAHGVQRVHMWRRGVDDQRFHPRHRSSGLRRALASNGEVLVGFVGRLAVEKQVDLLADTSRLPGVRLVIVGDGPAAPALRKALPKATFVGVRLGAQLARLYASLDIFVHTGPYETFGQAVRRPWPAVRFLGHIRDRVELAGLLATADVALAPGPVETFGLAALEALASGTPVVCSAESALPEVIGDAGRAARGSGRAYAAAVQSLMSRPDRRAAARERAAMYRGPPPWTASSPPTSP